MLRTENLTEAKSKHLRKYGIEKNFDFWKGPATGEEADILVAPTDLKTLKSWLQNQDIGFSVLNKNIQEDINKEKMSTFLFHLGK